MLTRAGLSPEQVKAKLDVLVPIGFALPSLGKLLRLLFIPFAAWNSGTDLSASDMSTLAINGPLSMFGSVHIAIPFLLDVSRIPVDEYQLYLVARIVTSRFGEALSAMGLVAFALLSRWITIHRDGPDFRRLHDDWITGKTVARQQPRWNVLQDVFGWVPSSFASGDAAGRKEFLPAAKRQSLCLR